MTDWCGEFLPAGMPISLLNEMNDSVQHVFFPLTKRYQRLYELLSLFYASSHKYEANHIIFGVTVAEQKDLDNALPWLQKIKQELPHLKMWISYEPAIGPVDWTPVKGLVQWIVAGAESAQEKAARRVDPKWLLDTKNFCVENKIAFFFKQWNEKDVEPLLDGKYWREFPDLGR
jgi:protein gp37